MAGRDDEDELERIVREQKPGFTIERRADTGRAPKDVRLPSDNTPDTESLRAKAYELERGSGAKPGSQRNPKDSKSASSDPLIEKYLGTSPSEDDPARLASDINSEAPDDISIVNVRPDHPSDNPDRPMKPKKVIISRSSKKIIGEQG